MSASITLTVRQKAPGEYLGLKGTERNRYNAWCDENAVLDLSILSVGTFR